MSKGTTEVEVEVEDMTGFEVEGTSGVEVEVEVEDTNEPLGGDKSASADCTGACSTSEVKGREVQA